MNQIRLALNETDRIANEDELARLALDLGAINVGGPMSEGESGLVARAELLDPGEPRTIEAMRVAILAGSDPLGDMFNRIRTPHERRARGAYFTPRAIVDPMVE
ncbi:MAG: hypothetical protein EPO26_15860 [Chloroflexota bacterium]|nr:MAG: hypothetical protein EPO26_15860 [Chloroflexota bacterium]